MRLPPRLYPITAKLQAALGRRFALSDIAETAEVIEPASLLKIAPVLMLERDRARVTASQEETTLAHEWARIDGAPQPQEAKTRYVIRDVLATPYGFYTARSGQALSGGMRMGALLKAPVHRAGHGFFAGSHFALRYFGHWLRDALPMTLLCPADAALYLPIPPTWPHARAYAEALRIDRLPHDFVHFDTLTFCHDIGKTAAQRARVAEIRARVQAVLPPPGPGRVYLARGATGQARMLENEAELIAALEAQGFVTAHAGDPLDRLWSVLSGARQIVTVEGSHWAHAYYTAAPGALHLTLNPADRFNNVFADYMPAIGGRLATSVMMRAGNGYRVDVAGVLDLLDRAGE